MKVLIFATTLGLCSSAALAQVSISVGGPGGVSVNTGGDSGVNVNTGKSVDVTTGKTSPRTSGNAVYVNPGQNSSSITHSPGTQVTTRKDNDDDSSGVSVLNGQVRIDGVKVPPTATRWTGKDGTKYRIKRSGKGNVSVEEIDD